MTEAAGTGETADAGPPPAQQLDPFGFHPGVASRIAGLGGDQPGYEHDYAFHTHYVEAAPGMAHFQLRFEGLRARLGTLQLLVNMLPLEPGAHARVATSERIQLNRIVQNGGLAEIRFEAFRGVSFALHGKIVDVSDAEAAALDITLDRPLDPDAIDPGLVEARSSAFGADTVRPASHLLSLGRPTLAAPVCQMLTARQLREPAFGEWSRALGSDRRDPAADWSRAYVLQVLRGYGMLEPGARALGLGAETGAVASLLGGQGLDVTVAGHGASVDVDLATLPGAFVNYDVVWSEGAAAGFGSAAAGASFVESVMGCLRPGGLAVHVVPFAQVGTDAHAFAREDVERLALTLISRNYQVAQVKVATQDVLRTEAERAAAYGLRFGLVGRRPPSAY